ncbi:MAG: histidine phosphatase family protein [Gaiellaceae bacterium]
MKTLLAARHGESEFSAKQLVNGDPGVECPLTGAGRAQARVLGEVLAEERVDLCAVTEFQRVRETAALALAGRDVPFLVVPELNDPHYGRFEGGPLGAYLEWAWASGPLDAPGDGEHRGAVAARYARGLRTLLSRPEETVLLVAHSLPLAYLRDAAAGRPPATRSDQVAYAELVRLGRVEVEQAAAVLENWVEAPVFRAD